MTALALVCLARHAATTFADLARDLAAAVRPGDHVLIVDDSGDEATAPRIGRFLAEEGWPRGVTGTALITGAAGAGDTGVAINLALAALAVPGQRPAGAHHLLFVTAGSRIDAAALAEARDLAAGHDLVLLPWRQWSLALGRPVDAPEAPLWPARPGEETAARARRIAPPLQGLMLRDGLIGSARAAEGGSSHGDLALVWHVLSRARSVAVMDRLAGHRPEPPAAGTDLERIAATLAAVSPEAAEWVAAHLPRWRAPPPEAGG